MPLLYVYYHACGQHKTEKMANFRVWSKYSKRTTLSERDTDIGRLIGNHAMRIEWHEYQ